MSAANKKLLVTATVALLVSTTVVYAANRVPSVKRLIG